MTDDMKSQDAAEGTSEASTTATSTPESGASESADKPAKRKRSLISKLIRTFAVLFILLIVALAVVFFYANDIAKAVVERGGTYALGVETKVEKISLALTGGQTSIDKLHVKNPEGYDEPDFMLLNRGEVDLQIGDLTKEQIEIKRIALKDVKMSLIKKAGKANYDVILENLEKLKAKEDAAGEEPPKDEPGKPMIIRELLIEDVHVVVDLLPIGGKASRIQVNLDEIKMKDLGSDGSGVKMGELTGIIIQAVLSAVVNKAGSILPGDIGKGLTQGLAGLGDMGKFGMEITGKVTTQAMEMTKEVGKHVGKAAETLGKEAGKVGEKAGKEADKVIKGIGKGIGDLLGGKKDEEKEKPKE